MDSIISVIVTAYNDCRYLVRCLNSIKRQTYKNVEIIVIAKEEIDTVITQENGIKVVSKDRYVAISDAINASDGDYVFFCSSDSILPENTLEVLVSLESSSAICPCVKVYTRVNLDYSWNIMSNISIYGKLFKKENIRKLVDESVQKSWFDEFHIVMSYLGQCEEIAETDEAIIYESRKENLIECVVSKEQSDDYWKSMLLKVANYNEKIRYYITQGIGEVIAETQDNMEEWMYFAEKVLHNDVWLNYVLANKVIEKWWILICQGENQKVYDAFRTYLLKYENEVLIEMFLNDCGLSTSMYDVLKNNNQQIFLQVMEKMKRNNMSAQAGAITLTIQEQSEELSGVMLAEYVIGKFRDGKLGLKTIIKSFAAWVKFKV